MTTENSATQRYTALYRGSTTHARRKPSSNRFTYGVYMAYVDLAELESGHLDNWPLFSSRTPWALVSLLARDHMSNEPLHTPLSTRVRDVVERETGTRPSGPIRLLTNLRVLGVEFNPVSFYYIFDSAGENVQILVAEVSNFPWFEQHNYVIQPVEAETGSAPLQRFRGHQKAFHVSPFMPINEISYDWLVGRPDERVQVRIGLHEKDDSFFMASLDARRLPWSTRNLLAMQAFYPLHTLSVMAGILYEAGKLFKRGFTFFPHPNSTETALSMAVAKVIGTVHAVTDGCSRLVRGKQPTTI